MPAYVLVEVEVKDPVRYAEYVQQVPPTIARYGGRFVIRGGRAELLEGGPEPKRIVLLEFDSVDRAKEWWGSDEYRAPKALRQAASTARMIVVEGYRG